MKLNNTLIVTLPDFARHFSFIEFWENRRQFVRDMNPQRVYYWSKELSDAYFLVSKWIEKGEQATADDCKAGCKALSYLVGKEIDASAATIAGDSDDYSAKIINISSGKTVRLPQYQKHGSGSVSLAIHKIEVYGKSGTVLMVSIGKGKAIKLMAGDFVYATAVKGGGFVEFLPKTMRGNEYELTMVSQKGDFLSTLIVRNLRTMKQEQISGVVSFALAEDGYMYINGDGKLILMSNFVLSLKAFLSHNSPTLYVKSYAGDVAVLYADGMLKSSRSLEGKKNVVSVTFDERGELHFIM